MKTSLHPALIGLGKNGLTALAASALLVLANPWAVPSQTSEAAIVKEFKIPDYYPNTQNLKTLLIGAEAKFQINQPIPIKGLLIETYASDGKTNLIIQAADCIYNTENQTASSNGHLQMRTADGRFHLEGDGFLWRQTESKLVVSNRVCTMIYGDFFKSQGPKR
ncbi:MAG: hypothetical protein M1608_05650 [Candidatus Omnitrophica bacterium]|nr:hypothetical protein [Candidatus Omnitrophota bacterium]